MGKENGQPPLTTGVFRSEKMNLYNMFVQPAVLFDVTAELGELGIVEFQDLNEGVNAFQRTFVDEVRRVEDIERHLLYLNEQVMNEDTISINMSNNPLPQNVPVPKQREIIRMEANVEELDRNLRDVNEHLQQLRIKQMEFIEMNHVLLKTHRSLEAIRRDTRTGSVINELFQIDGDGVELAQFSKVNRQRLKSVSAADQVNSSKYGMHTVMGLIRTEKCTPFHTMIWRICGPNALVQFHEIDTPIDDVVTEQLVKKKVFVVMCHGYKLYDKIQKICEGFRTSVYRVPSSKEEFREMSQYIETNMKDIKTVIEQTMKQRCRLVSAVSQPENLRTWQIQVTKLKAIYAMMNLYRKTEKGFIGEVWCAETDMKRLQTEIESISVRAGVQGQAAVELVATNRIRPTFYRMNKFTSGFQGIVDSYGIARYREMNPAPYTAISFPFLFAIMFADAGHGIIMFLFALWMVLFERKLSQASNNEIWLMFFNGRYIVLLMGCFSIYTGAIYNDMFAKSINLFGSAFVAPMPQHYHNGTNNSSFYQFSKEEMYIDKSDFVYPFGIDPVWQLSENKIIFLNSFKMKLSVILGVLQMLFGVMISLINHINFRSTLSIIFEFIPQLIWLLSLFGYMITLIFIKWLRVWDPSKAPSILIDFINMFLMKYPEQPEYLRPWFAHKREIQTILLAMALLSVPIMLLVKPTILVCGKRRRTKHIVSKVDNDIESMPSGTETTNEHEESTGDIYIHQAIHTIEFCLGSISHTASYLRLWALSLAHSQLSEVLWNMVLCKGLNAGGDTITQRIIGAIMLFLAFGFWAVLTVLILILMEGLSAFLHAIRLHWVEFQSKFYIGDGYSFQPFSFDAILTARIED
ncbi:hypothetical protein RDWZM_009930 [Blomia tropicalis]|uniref:V-type proton ATPase subunit a n=1 Tax=Blomia tropicalis TaxID=40697 RepID=A0A9Q0LXI5_BLOTA|nr:hypothetical protein RDWZM_009930 [Blomia tropicalis]